MFQRRSGSACGYLCASFGASHPLPVHCFSHARGGSAIPILSSSSPSGSILPNRFGARFGPGTERAIWREARRSDSVVQVAGICPYLQCAVKLLSLEEVWSDLHGENLAVCRHRPGDPYSSLFALVSPLFRFLPLPRFGF